MGTVICLFVICILIIALAVMWYYYNFINKPINVSVNESTSISNPINTNVNATENKVKSLKIDDSKEWVYDAEYEKNISASSYSIYYKTFYAKDIIVPFININSTYGSSANSEIKEIFDKAIKTYNDGVNDGMTYVDECNYKKYVNDNLLSIVLTYGVGATSVVHPMYYTYNFSLEEGNKLSYEDIYKIAGFTNSNIDSKVQDAITKTMKDKMSNFTADNYPNGKNFDTYNNESINNYKKSISNNTLQYFLSENGKLNIVVKLSIPADTGEFDTIITVE